jgi:MarR family transcriptional regulator, organic hydroperoxide resistance regulator
VTPAQSEVITVLGSSPDPLSVKELGELLVCETGSPSRLARSVVEAGWAEPVASERDGRVTRLRLTPRGQATAAQIAEVEQAFHEQLAATLGGPAALDGLVDALRSVVGDGPAGRALARRRTTAA